jgi:hypothetical protein
MFRKVKFTVNYNGDRHYGEFTRTYSENEINLEAHIAFAKEILRDGIMEGSRNEGILLPASDIASVQFEVLES